ncbi:alpha/beta hydrolase [Glutamicibacter sp. JC586]|uniref:alpha/beta hydrolase n=1 Tax=Glutamicibacter sp. JC586 TaxID=2590552 RepID=UPI00135C38B2|nr:alpha/beta hydrolase [Glutamicibacter sp. JC586]
MNGDVLPRIADSELEAWLTAIAEQGHSAPSIAQLRAKRARPGGPDIPVVNDLVIAADGGTRIPVRTYRHDTMNTRATCVYAHGGAFVFGDLDSHDRACRRLAALGGVDVVAVDYRLAPEHPAPAGIDDVRAVLGWLEERVAGEVPIGLAGDSAGALIAFLAACASDVAIDQLLLINPNVDLALSKPSVLTKGEGWGLDARDLEWFVSQWAPTAALRESHALSPLQQPPSTAPMTTIITSEHDPLRDEGLDLVEHLRNAGRLTAHHHLEGMVHGVINLDTISPTARRMGDEFLTDFAEDLNQSRD